MGWGRGGVEWAVGKGGVECTGSEWGGIDGVGAWCNEGKEGDGVGAWCSGGKAGWTG